MSIREAVGHYRLLVEQQGDLSAGDLAGSLHNLSDLHRRGRRLHLRRWHRSARPSSSTGCRPRPGRRLFLADLAGALDELAECTARVDGVPAATDSASRLVSGFARPAVRARLRATLATWFLARGEVATATDHLQSGIAEADDVDDPLVGPARRALRAAVDRLGPEAATLHDPDRDWPAWVVLPIDEASDEVIRAWANSPDWEAQSRLIRANAALVASEAFRTTLDVSRDLYPGDRALPVIGSRMAEFDRRGIDETLAVLDQTYLVIRTMDAWKALTSTDTSKHFLDEHRAVLRRDDVAASLREAGDRGASSSSASSCSTGRSASTPPTTWRRIPTPERARRPRHRGRRPRP